MSPNKDTAIASPIMCSSSSASPRWRAMSRQYLVAQYARLAQHAAGRGADELLARVIDARERVATTAGRRRCCSRSPRSFFDRPRRRRRHSALAPGRRHDRRNTTVTRRTDFTRSRRRKSGRLSGGRCCRSPTACWPRPMYGSRRFPLVGAGASIRRNSARQNPRRASLVQLFGLVFRGLSLVTRLKRRCLPPRTRPQQSLVDYVAPTRVRHRRTVARVKSRNRHDDCNS